MEENNNINNQEQIMNQDDNKPNKGKKSIFIIILVFLLLGGGIFVYYKYFVKDNNKKQKETHSVEVKKLSNKNALSGNTLENFDLAFMKKNYDGENLVYSPLSIKYALEMLREGSDGKSKDELTAILGEYENNTYVNSKNMSFANAFFIKDSFESSIKDVFIKSMQKKYNADVILDSFANPNNINKWVKDKTLGLIDGFESDLSNKDIILANALAIDMEWNKKIRAVNEDYFVKYPHENADYSIPALLNSGYQSLDFFDNQNVQALEIGSSANKYDIISDLGEDYIYNLVSKEYEEWLAEGGCSGNSDSEPDVNTFMTNYMNEIKSNYKEVSSSTDFNFYDDSDVKVFAKDLQEYDNVTLQYVGIMPKLQDIDDFIDDIDAEYINKIISSLKDISLDSFEEGYITRIKGFIPMFNMNSSIDIKDNLEDMGVKEIFNTNLSKVSSAGLVIDNISQKAVIDFSNDGIKAGALTQVFGAGDASCEFDHIFDVPMKEINLTFDKPFIYFVRNKSTGEVWLAGVVTNPNSYAEYEKSYGNSFGY